jgi:glutamyl-tRNA synthetase
VQTRVTTLAEVPRYVDFLFLEDAPIDEASWAKTMKDGAADVLDGVIDVFGTVPWSAEVLKPAVEEVGEARGLSKSKAQAPVRVAVTGRTVGPPLYESLELLGRERTIARLRAARSRL